MHGDPHPATLKVLQEVFGYDSFRGPQQAIIEHVIAGGDALVLMPTGGGKSLCYQLPALCRDGVTVVISPLIALMRDQVRALREAGVAAGALTSGNTEAETDETLTALRDRTLKLLYIAPERLAASGTERLLRAAGVSLIAVDEAHCVSQWGHEFRPDYLKIGELRRQLGVPLSAFTATADAETRAEIVTRLFGDHPPKTFLRGLIAQTFIWPLLLKTTRVDRLLIMPMRGVGSRGLCIAEHDQKPKAWQRHWRTKGTKPVSIMGEWTPLVGAWLRNALIKKKA